MVSQKEMSKINELESIICDSSELTSVQLCMKSSLSIATFNKLRPFLLEIKKDTVQFDGHVWSKK